MQEYKHLITKHMASMPEHIQNLKDSAQSKTKKSNKLKNCMDSLADAFFGESQKKSLKMLKE